ncbi:MAG: O-antigen ligase family protein [Nitrospira sp.]|nr:O-antigen ligase family protein [Nitrospira sp.]
MNSFNCLLAIMSVAVFFTNLPNYLHIHRWGIVPYQWVVGFGIVALPLFVRQVSKSNVLGRTVVGWSLLYLIVSLLWFIPSAQDDMAWQEVRSRALTAIELMVFFILFADQQMNRIVRHALVAGVLVGVGLNVYEVFVPLSFSEIIGRSAGLYINPTTSSLALVGGMIITVTILPRWFRGIFVLIVGVGVLSTFSRGGIILWIVATAGFVISRQIPSRDVVQAMILGSVIFAVLVIQQGAELLDVLTRTGVLNANVEERLEWLTDPSGVQDRSGWARTYVAKRLWEKYAETPFFGEGTGAAYSAFEIPPHNQYLLLMVDHGLVGMLLFPLLILSVVYEARGGAITLVLVFGGMQALAGLMSNTLLTEPQTLLLFAVAATMPSREEDDCQTSVQRLDQKGLTPQPA